MAFFENISKKVGEVASTAAKKSGDLVEVTKLNMNIGAEEDKIQKLYTKMGKTVSESYCSGSEPDGNFAEDCEAIKAHEKTIESLKAKVREIKNASTCSNCGAEVNKASAFCPKCGSRVDTVPQQTRQEPSGKTCPNCNAPLDEGAEFCTGCGSKVE